jgi:hypothetical protein
MSYVIAIVLLTYKHPDESGIPKKLFHIVSTLKKFRVRLGVSFLFKNSATASLGSKNTVPLPYVKCY